MCFPIVPHLPHCSGCHSDMFMVAVQDAKPTDMHSILNGSVEVIASRLQIIKATDRNDRAYTEPVAFLRRVAAVRTTMSCMLVTLGLPLRDHFATMVTTIDDERLAKGYAAPHLPSRNAIKGVASERSVPVLAAAAASALTAGAACDVLPALLSACHQTINGEASRLHFDVMGPMPESKVVFPTGEQFSYAPELAACGSVQRLPPGALDVPAYGVATLLACPSLAANGRSAGDVEVSCNVSPGGVHANAVFQPFVLSQAELASMSGAPPMPTARLVFDRASGRVHVGASLCDHPVRGSRDWYTHIRVNYGLSRNAGRAMLHHQIYVTRWIMLTPAQRTAYIQTTP